MKKGIFIALLFFTLDGNAAFDSQSLVDAILREGLVVSPEIDADGVRNQLGAPLNYTTQDIKNKYSERNDQLETLFYKDLKIVIYTFNHPEHGWSKVAQVEVSGNSYNVPIKIGTTKDGIVGLLGKESASSTEGTWYYYSSEEETHLQLIIKFQGNRVSEVIWSNMP